ncbi:30S ribosomal protein S1 [bacterium BMS3Abin07]|nr:30S ribosomal protein S1 [bacterium BMS3Abin07]GBE32985.1 30S ribosomal protein S1 [bacterium BMS3Bbin05]
MSEEIMKSHTPSSQFDTGQDGDKESFAELFEKNGRLPERLKPGQKISAKIISLSGDVAFLDLGGKSEGIIDLDEFRDEDGKISVSEGQEIEAFFVSSKDGLMKMTTLLRGNPIASLNAIESAHKSGNALEGIVARKVKGGYEVKIHGVRSFCPMSQIDLRVPNDSTSYLNKSFHFKILEYKKEGQNTVVSRRAILEEERRSKIEKLKETIEEGTDVSGRISSIHNFGVFVDLDGLDALIPVSELSWGRIDNPADLFSVGQDVTAKVISADWGNERLSLSIKATQPDPWSSLQDKYPEGTRVHGTIVRLVPFGAFVALEPGIDGLIHISNLGTGRRIKHPKEIVREGQAIEAYVISLDPSKRKISLSIQPSPEKEKIKYPEEGTIVEGTVENVMPYGIFLKFTEKLTGLIPSAEMSTPRGSDHARMFPVGSLMKAVVIDVDKKSGRVRLSRKAVEEKEVRSDLETYKNKVKEEHKSSDGMGSLGKLLKSKMEEKKIAF